MALLNAVNNLKERPRDEKKVIAGGVAIAVIIVLFLTWAVLFFKKIQNTEPIQLDNVREDFVDSFPSTGSENTKPATQ